MIWPIVTSSWVPIYRHIHSLFFKIKYVWAMWYYKNTWHSIGNSIYALTAYFTLDYPVLNCKTFFDITQHLHPPFPLMWFDHWLLTKHFPKGLRKSMLPIYPNLAWTHSLNCLFITSDSWINQSWTARNPKQKKLLLLLLLLSHFSRVWLCATP